MVGKIYLEVAKRYLDIRYKDMPEDKKNALLARGDFAELESYIGAKESIWAAIDGFNCGCYFAGLPDYFYLDPDSFMEEAVISETGANKWQEKLDRMAQSEVPKNTEVLSSVVLISLEVIHNTWVSKSTEKYFDLNHKDKRFMFMPLALIGWAEVKKDLVYLMPILDATGFNLSEDDVKFLYNRTRERLPYKELVSFIMHLGETYESLDKSIATSLKQGNVACRIATQCIEAADKE